MNVLQRVGKCGLRNGTLGAFLTQGGARLSLRRPLPDAPRFRMTPSPLRLDPSPRRLSRAPTASPIWPMFRPKRPPRPSSSSRKTLPKAWPPTRCSAADGQQSAQRLDCTAAAAPAASPARLPAAKDRSSFPAPPAPTPAAKAAPVPVKAPVKAPARLAARGEGACTCRRDASRDVARTDDASSLRRRPWRRRQSPLRLRRRWFSAGCHSRAGTRWPQDA